MLLDSGIELTTTRFQNLTSVIEINQFLSVKKKKKNFENKQWMEENKIY